MSPAERVLELVEPGRERAPGSTGRTTAGSRRPGRARAADRPRSSRPERETPGTSATHCTRPMMTASRQREVRSRRAPGGRGARRTSITPLHAISAIATTHSERSGPVIRSLASKPTTPIGIEPTMTYQPIRWSSVPRQLGLHQPDATRPSRSGRCRARSTASTAAIAPIWITAVNAGDRRVVHLQAEQLLGDREVAGAGHGEELGQPLDDAEDDCLPVVHLLFLVVRFRAAAHPTGQNVTAA